MDIKLQSKNENLYLPKPVKIIECEKFTTTEKFFKLKILDGQPLKHSPGQFVQLGILGTGEAPISVSSPPTTDNTFEICVRAVGDVTKKLHTLKKGDHFHIRGPFGHGFDRSITDTFKGKHLLLIAGGLGYVPLRSLINKIIPERKNYKKISLLCGFRTPADRVYVKELEALHKLGENVEILETVDKNDTSTWQRNIGVITTLIPKVQFSALETIAIIVGPPIMYKFVLKSLKDRHMSDKSIYMSLERRMECGIGKCGHCQMGGVYVCQKGPVFNYADVVGNPEIF